MIRPPTVEAAVALLAAEPAALPLAGGTDLVIDLRTGRAAAALLVDLTAIPGLAGVTGDRTTIRIGAMTTVRSIETDRILCLRAPALVEAARVLGSVQIRNMATLGGNLCHATPSADLPPALMVHDAEAVIHGPDGERRIPVAGLFTGPGATCLSGAELLAEVELVAPGDGFGSCYLRQTVRRAMDLAGVGVAASLRVVDGVVRNARVALGAVAPRPLLVGGMDAQLAGRPLDRSAAEDAGRTAADASSPITDVRGTERYRRRVVETLVARALKIAAARATGRLEAGVLAPVNGLLPGGRTPGWDVP